jgi:hypothetical protein
MLGIPVGHFGQWCLKNGCPGRGVGNDAGEADFVEMSGPNAGSSPPQHWGSVPAAGFPPSHEAHFRLEICELRAQLALRGEAITSLEAKTGRLTGCVGAVLERGVISAAADGAITLLEIDGAHPLLADAPSSLRKLGPIFPGVSCGCT